MSGFSTPPAGTQSKQPKQMSSRLMTMKFMQRAVNSERNQSPSQTPASEPPLKRQRTEDYLTTSGPTTPASGRLVFLDRKALAAAIKAEAATEALARARNQASGAETEWVLDLKLPITNGNVSQVQDDEFEDEDEDDIWSQPLGRQTYGSFKRKKKTPKPPIPKAKVDNDADLSPMSSSESESGEVSDTSSSSEDDASASSAAKKRKSVPVDYEHQADMDRLDKIDLSKSSYARSKGDFKPRPYGSGFGNQNKHHKGGGGKSGKPQLNPNKQNKKARKTL